VSHTPGPWKVDYSYRSKYPFGISRAAEPHTMVLVSRSFSRRTTAEAEANAHLIAAAPDLLARVKARFGNCDCHDAARGIAVCDDCQADRAAIAKAEGK
jgi:hypothetical protein